MTDVEKKRARIRHMDDVLKDLRNKIREAKNSRSTPEPGTTEIAKVENEVEMEIAEAVEKFLATMVEKERAQAEK